MKTADGGKTWSLSLKVAFTDPEYGQITSKGDQVDVVLYGGSGMSQTSYSYIQVRIRVKAGIE